MSGIATSPISFDTSNTIVVSNCYSVCQPLVSGYHINKSYKFESCYATLHSDQTLFGEVIATNSFSADSCFAVGGDGLFTSISADTISTNNLSVFAYDTFYRNPSVSGNYLYNYAFTNGGRDTNSFYDLALPINKLLFPTITDEVKQKHNWTRLNGYKRYTTTIQQ